MSGRHRAARRLDAQRGALLRCVAAWLVMTGCSDAGVASTAAGGGPKGSGQDEDAAVSPTTPPSPSDAQGANDGGAETTPTDGAPAPDEAAATQSLSVTPPPDCPGMFGRPIQATGLSEAQCRPYCECSDGLFAPPDYGEAELAALESWTLLDPPELLGSDPYDAPETHAPEPSRVCAVVPEPARPRAYRLRSFESADAAHAAGAWITHTGACGQCSSLADLAVYIRHGDLTTPVRQCGLDNFAGRKDKHMECLQKLGFSEPCAEIWYYNTVHTRGACLGPCLAALRQNYHKEDGTLNACIQCDEDQSGPVFKAVAGRTRRNSGLPSALCRPCNTVSRVVHRYPPE